MQIIWMTVCSCGNNFTFLNYVINYSRCISYTCKNTGRAANYLRNSYNTLPQLCWMWYSCSLISGYQWFWWPHHIYLQGCTAVLLWRWQWLFQCHNSDIWRWTLHQNFKQTWTIKFISFNELKNLFTENLFLHPCIVSSIWSFVLTSILFSFLNSLTLHTRLHIICMQPKMKQISMLNAGLSQYRRAAIWSNVIMFHHCHQYTARNSLHKSHFESLAAFYSLHIIRIKS